MIEKAAYSSACQLSREYEVYAINEEGHKKFADCLPCPHCPLGKGLEPECGSQIRNNSTITCKPCITGKTFSDKIGIESCKSCDDCHNKLILKTCTLESKQICAKTLCQQGYYHHWLTGNCRPCSRCCDQEMKDIRPRECAHMPDKKNCEVTHHACSQKNTQTTTDIFTTVTTGVPSTGVPITGSKAIQRLSTAHDATDYTITSASNSNMTIGTLTTNETTGVLSPTWRVPTVVNTVTTSDGTSPESVTEATKKASSSAQTGIWVAVALVALVIFIGVSLLKRYKRKGKKSFSGVAVEPLLPVNQYEMILLHCFGKLGE